MRWFKKDVLPDLRQNIPERHVEGVEAIASTAEKRVFQKLYDLKLTTIDRQRQGGQLFKTTLLKAFLSNQYRHSDSLAIPAIRYAIGANISTNIEHLIRYPDNMSPL